MSILVRFSVHIRKRMKMSNWFYRTVILECAFNWAFSKLCGCEEWIKRIFFTAAVLKARMSLCWSSAGFDHRSSNLIVKTQAVHFIPVARPKFYFLHVNGKLGQKFHIQRFTKALQAGVSPDSHSVCGLYCVVVGFALRSAGLYWDSPWLRPDWIKWSEALQCSSNTHTNNECV